MYLFRLSIQISGQRADEAQCFGPYMGAQAASDAAYHMFGMALNSANVRKAIMRAGVYRCAVVFNGQHGILNVWKGSQ